MIPSIRKFIGANYYCKACCSCFNSENTFTNHFQGLCSILSDEKIQPVNKSKILATSCNHYMHGDISKGSDEERNHKDENTNTTLEVI